MLTASSLGLKSNAQGQCLMIDARIGLTHLLVSKDLVDASAAAKSWDLLHLDTSDELLRKAADIRLPAGVGHAQSTGPLFNMGYNPPLAATYEPNMQQAAEPRRQEYASHGRARTGVCAQSPLAGQ